MSGEVGKVDLTETPRGMDDLLPVDMRIKRRIEDVIREVYLLYGYEEIDTPTLEYRTLFEAKSGDEIRHRMFTFIDPHGRALALRPEVTASVARVVASKLSSEPLPLRLGYIADCYRYDEPQWGRRRRFWHGGFELFGSRDSMSDAEIIVASHEVFNRLGMRNHYYKIGHVGIIRGILGEAGINEKTQDKFLSMIDRNMIEDAYELIHDKAEKEAIDAIKQISEIRTSEIKEIESAKDIISPWKSALSSLENLLDIIFIAREAGVSCRILIDLGFARGLEYYTGLIFEQYVEGVNIAFNGGGRYDNLVKLLGGKDIPAVGCAIGITRIQTYLSSIERDKYTRKMTDILLAPLSERTRAMAFQLAKNLRENGVYVEVDVMGKRLPSLFEYCEKKGIRYIGILGDKELEENKITIRDLLRREQKELSIKEIAAIIKLIKE